ncbi:MAG: S-layer homology domain-containing protein, partial [Firmicutes bacterium]|nr:S-layer homology domain-containing protein [Bacillota bacterium]
LKSADEILSTAKGIEILGLSDDAAVKYSYIYEEGDGSYTISLSLTNGVYITADAKTGEILSIYNYHYDNAPNPDKNAATADAAREKIDAFLNEYSSKFGEYKEVGSEESDGSLSLGYVRYINDIPCYADNIYIRYDLESDELSSYRISYTDISFPSPDNIISADEAYNTILENGGLERQYICAAENDYRLCVTLANYYSAVDAFTGKIEKESVQSEYSHDSYTDIDGHWCQAAVQILEQSGIAFNGNLLKPDEPITQSDLLRLVGAVIDGMTTETMTCDEETLYHRVDEIQPFFEDNTTAGVTRENACVYFARALDVAKYAADANMFKNAFSDADNISADKVGYIALLASAGAINKNGAFRPQDYITYAEACTILYNILNLGL